MAQPLPVTILFVDDDVAFRAAVARTLREARFLVREAATGTEALALAGERFDLVLLDGSLPDMGAGEVVARLKEQAGAAAAPVLYLSDDCPEGPEQRPDADAHLRKPVGFAALFGAVDALLRSRGAAPATAEGLPLYPRLWDRHSGGPPAEEAARRRLRVLVVEDHAGTAVAIGGILRMEGHAVRLAAEGLAAIEIAQAWRPHLVLLDLRLPGLDGYEVARRLRQMDEMRNALIVALTAFGRQEDRERSRAAGCDDHLVKPVDWPELAAVLARAAAGA